MYFVTCAPCCVRPTGRERLGTSISIMLVGCSQPSHLAPVRTPRPKTVGDICLDDPGTAFPGVIDVSQGIATSSPFSEAMGMITELDIKVRIQDQAHRFCHKFI